MKIEMYEKPGLFYVLSTFLPWTLWFVAAYLSHAEPGNVFLANLSSVVALLGLVAPIAVAVYFVAGNAELKADLLGRFFNFKGIKTGYILISCFLMLTSILLGQAVSLLFGYSADQFRLADSFSFTSGVFPVWFMLIIAPILEELAWHTYGTDCLRARFNLFRTSVIFALFWGFWHFPLSFIKDYYHSNLVEDGWIYPLNFLVSLFPFVIIMNWIYYKTNRNILLPIIFHITAGFFNEIFATHPMSKVFQTGLLLVVSVYLLVSDRKLFFEKELVVKNPAPSPGFRKTAKYGLMLALVFLAGSSGMFAQTVSQSIRGRVFDNTTNESLPFAGIQILDTHPVKGTTSNADGIFTLEKVPVGRISLRVDMLGYESYVINELLVSSGKELVLNIAMQPGLTELNEVVVRASKDSPLNSMSTVSARQFTVEETQRYAGGLDDPARLVTSFAGVASPAISSSGISVRGNNPDGLLWRIEGVEVPNPNHFADLTIAGGGMLTAISSQMMGNSDFFTGAFPAEYGNASSGVFDIKLNSGNNTSRQYTVQAGLLGMDFAAQGPFVNGRKATYNLNYRYSTMALVAPVLPDDAGVLKYQDISFKTDFPTKKHGVFSFWGIAALDGVDMVALDSLEWKTNADRDNSQTSMYLFATGLNHKLNVNPNTFLSSTVAASGNGLSFSEQRLDYKLQPHPQSGAENQQFRLSVLSNISTRLGARHSNKSGFNLQYMNYNLAIEQSLSEGTQPIQLADRSGSTGLMQVYSQSKIQLTPKIRFNLGLNSQYFALNKEFALEPRAGISYESDRNHQFALAFGRHSRIEQLSVYFTEIDGGQPNKNLGLMKSAHFVFSYTAKLHENMRLSVEPYFQKLNQVPVAPVGYQTTLNNANALFFNEVLCNEGSAKNLGLDVTLERYLHKGFYYLISASVFDSKYTDSQGVERNTRYNKNYLANFVAGKEWNVGRNKNNLLGINARCNYIGGNRLEPVNLSLSAERKKIVYGETGGTLAFSEKSSDIPAFSLTVSYRKNKPNHSSVWSLQLLNANRAKEFADHYYNYKTGTVESKYEGIMIPNISYRIEF